MRQLGRIVLAAIVMAAPVWAGAPARELRPEESRLGINLAGPADWNSELPFVDVFRLARKWISQRKGQPWGKGPELERDGNGWVRKLEPDCWAETPLCTIRGGHYPAGQYVCLYEGEGKVEFWNIKREVSREPGRIVFEPQPDKGGFWLRIKETKPDDYVRNIRVLMPGFEKTHEAEPFHPAFLERWKSFHTYRFMDWMKTNGSTVSTWEQRPKPADCTWTERGIPVEVMVDLCNRQRVTPWFCMPHLASDDYVRNFAKVVKARLDPELKVTVEYSNEIWNSIFAQTRYANEQGQKRGFGERPWEAGWRYCAWRSVQIFRIWEEVFGGTDRLVRVIASQCNPYVSERKLEFQGAWKHTDALGIAPYIGFNVPREGKKGRPGADEVAAWPLEKLLGHIESGPLPKAIEQMRKHKALAEKYKVELVAYEAGQHLVGVGGGENNEPLTKLFRAANRSARMGALYTRYLDAWKQAGGDLLCIFSSVGRWSKWGSWGLAEHYDETEADQPKLKAVMEWNRANPREEAPMARQEPTVREIEAAVDHNHCTTRQFQHMTFHHDGIWFVFYSDGAHFQYQTSDDSGRTWRRAKEPVAPAPNGSTSFDVLQVGDRVYISHALYPLGRYDVNAPYAKDPARRGEYRSEGRVKSGRIEGREIRWLADVNPGFRPDYCNLVQDTDGRLCVFERHDEQGVVHRSRRPSDITEWLPVSVCIPVRGRHALDAAALDGGRLYAASVLTTGGKLYGNLYDGKRWGEECVLLADETTTVAGDDRRLALEFDPTSKRLHLIYVDAGSVLRYRRLDAPYAKTDWRPALSEPGRELAAGVFTCALSVDSSRTPYGLVITYGLEKHRGKDKRVRTGELYARRFDGKAWQGEPVLVSQPGTIHNWYPNVNQDVRDGLCVLYSRSVDRAHLGVPLAVMVSVCTMAADRPGGDR